MGTRVSERATAPSFVAAAYDPAKAGKEMPCCHCGELFVLDPVEWRDREREDMPVCESCAQAWHAKRPEEDRTAGATIPRLQNLVRQRCGGVLLFVNFDRRDCCMRAYTLSAKPSVSNKRQRKQIPTYADVRVVVFDPLTPDKTRDYERKAVLTSDIVKYTRGMLVGELGAKLDVPCTMVGGGTLGFTPEQAELLAASLLAHGAEDLLRQAIEREVAGGAK